MTSVRATNPAQLASTRTVEVVGARRAPSGLRQSPPEGRLPAVVVNPSNIDDVGKLRTQIVGVCAELGWAPPLWLETTVEDPGGGQATRALAAGADVVLVYGDGRGGLCRRRS
jgi:hypothetical protein